jgi:hypothetical protein
MFVHVDSFRNSLPILLHCLIFSSDGCRRYKFQIHLVSLSGMSPKMWISWHLAYHRTPRTPFRLMELCLVHCHAAFFNCFICNRFHCVSRLLQLVQHLVHIVANITDRYSSTESFKEILGNGFCPWNKTNFSFAIEKTVCCWLWYVASKRSHQRGKGWGQNCLCIPSTGHAKQWISIIDIDMIYAEKY